MVIRPMVAVVAADDPETAAKMPQLSTLTCINRPGSRRSQGANPLNMSAAKLVRKSTSPIQMNSGNGVNDHDQLCPHVVVAAIMPAGALLNSMMAINPVA